MPRPIASKSSAISCFWSFNGMFSIFPPSMDQDVCVTRDQARRCLQNCDNKPGGGARGRRTGTGCRFWRTGAPEKSGYARDLLRSGGPAGWSLEGPFSGGPAPAGLRCAWIVGGPHPIFRGPSEWRTNTRAGPRFPSAACLRTVQSSTGFFGEEKASGLVPGGD